VKNDACKYIVEFLLDNFLYESIANYSREKKANFSYK